MAKQTIGYAMTDEQVSNYSRELQDSTSRLEQQLGEAIWNATYTARCRPSAAIRCLNGLKGMSLEQDRLIEAMILRIQGEE